MRVLLRIEGNAHKDRYPEPHIDIEHTKTKAHHPQTNGICERFHKTILQEFYQTAFRRKIYGSLEALQHDLDAWIERYNVERTLPEPP